MNDDVFGRILHTLDTALDEAERQGRGHELAHDLDVAALRLQCLERRSGINVSESPYLAFLRRTTEHSHQLLAASA